jgi:hypothetical protein
MALVYFNPFDQFQFLFVLVIGLSTIGSFIIRYIFKDHVRTGQLVIRDNQITVNSDNVTQTLLNIRQIGFHYEGFHAATNLQAIPTKDGTGNILKISLDDKEQLEINLYLDNREQKEKLLYVLNWFCNKNNIEFSSGLLVSI